MHQLLAINSIYKAFKTNSPLEERGLFLGLPKVFDRVWKADLTYKLRQFQIYGKYSGLINSFLSNQYRRAVLNGQSSYWSQIIAVVLQDSILGPLLFLIYINDLLKGLNSNVKLFADDTSLFLVVQDLRVTTETHNEDLSKVAQWVHQWNMLFNLHLSKQSLEILFSRKSRTINQGSISLNNIIITRENVLKHLGLLLIVRLNFVEHINVQIKKRTKGTKAIRIFYLSLFPCCAYLY